MVQSDIMSQGINFLQNKPFVFTQEFLGNIPHRTFQATGDQYGHENLTLHLFHLIILP